MKQRIILKESEIREAVRKVIREYKHILTEKTSTLKWDNFIEAVEGIGAVIKKDGGKYKIFLPKANPDDPNEKKLFVTADPKHSGMTDSNTIANVKGNLEKSGWLSKQENRDKFPYELFGYTRPPKIVDTTQQDIQAANEKYADATVWRVFQTKDSICVLKFGNMYNLCNSENDRRPKCEDMWFDDYDFIEGKPCLIKAVNDDNFNCYPITQGGIDMKNYGVFESLNYGRRKRI